MIPYMRQCTIGTTLAHRLAVASAILCSVALATGQTGGERISWARVLGQPEAWYGSPEARRIADIVLRYQRGTGGWPKDIDMTVEPEPARLAPGDRPDSTIDNGATTTQVRLLARVAHATGHAVYRSAAQRGIDYLFAAQYANGGWPQLFPLRNDYSRYITYNDNAMVNVLTILRAAAAGTAPYTFVDADRRARSAAAVTRGIDVILRTQVRQHGRPTAWCAQHDENTLAPAWARNYEPPTLSGHESVDIVRFLMEIEKPSPAIEAAIEGAVDWLEAVSIAGLRIEEFTDAAGRRDRRVVADAAARPLWARFYELGTNRPVFTGRDRVIRYALADIEHERRNGYAYYGAWPATLLSVDYVRWRARRERP